MKTIFRKSLFLIILIPGSLAFMLLLYYLFGDHDGRVLFLGFIAFTFLNGSIMYFGTRWLRRQEEKQMNEVPSV